MYTELGEAVERNEGIESEKVGELELWQQQSLMLD
jgi:hypothetical protein